MTHLCRGSGQMRRMSLYFEDGEEDVGSVKHEEGSTMVKRWMLWELYDDHDRHLSRNTLGRYAGGAWVRQLRRDGRSSLLHILKLCANHSVGW